MAIIVSAPADLVVAVSDEILVRFVGIDLEATSWDGKAGVRVNLAALRGPETSRRDVEFWAAREAWADRLKVHGRGRAGDAPTMPGVAVLDRVGVGIVDDLGTVYGFIAGQVAGDGTDWDASWIYSPQPPAAAHRLELEFTLDGRPTGKQCTVALR